MLNTRTPSISGSPNKMVPPAGLFTSIAVLLALSVVFYYSMITVVPENKLWQAVLFVFNSLALLLIGLMYGRHMELSSGKKEVKFYKDFILHLHRAPTEENAYEVLFNYLCALPLDIQVFVSYTDDPDKETWTTLTNAARPVCNANFGECPLFRTGGCYKVANIRNTPHCHHLSPEDLSGSCYCINISGREYNKSLLQIYSPRNNAFDLETVTMLNSFIEVTKLFINNRRCFHLLNKKVNTDKLTGLYNRYFLEQYLENQIEAAMLSGQPLSLILIDIDNFKIYNDTYGHHAGDFVLSCFAEIAVASLRKSDAMVRYGGDEFIIILPCTDAMAANTIAERLTEIVSSAELPEFEGIRLPSLKFSYGISSYPNPARSSDELIRQADKALYRAKHNGSNSSYISANSY